MLLCICVIKSYLEFLKIITKPLHKDYFFPFIKSNRIIFTRELHYLSFQYFSKIEFSCRLERKPRVKIFGKAYQPGSFSLPYKNMDSGCKIESEGIFKYSTSLY